MLQECKHARNYTIVKFYSIHNDLLFRHSKDNASVFCILFGMISALSGVWKTAWETIISVTSGKGPSPQGLSLSITDLLPIYCSGNGSRRRKDNSGGNRDNICCNSKGVRDGCNEIQDRVLVSCGCVTCESYHRNCWEAARVRVAIVMVVSIAGMTIVDCLVTITIGGIQISCWFQISFRRGVSWTLSEAVNLRSHVNVRRCTYMYTYIFTHTYVRWWWSGFTSQLPRKD